MDKKEDFSGKNTFKKKPFKGKRREKPEFDQKVIDIARVTRVVKGGKRFSFRTVVVIGDRKGKVGVGVSKGPDMKSSTEKSYADAKKNMIKLSFTGNTIPYMIDQKLGSSKIILKPASKGNGVVAGGAVRTVISLAGIKDISGKMLGAKSKLNNARATIEALKQFSVKKIREDIVKNERKTETKNASKEENVDEKKAAKDDTKKVSKKKIIKKTENKK
ncbi:30S ribosomal protein S5 [Candidatus Parcubacteria bacterium]|nr:30S ribosomal protein S5 [Candidatus Parcubacteria bacterium]MCK5085508.1 30S ribosomal protein S5 [Candidatus Parcubacteria bacterium]